MRYFLIILLLLTVTVQAQVLIHNNPEDDGEIADNGWGWSPQNPMTTTSNGYIYAAVRGDAGDGEEVLYSNDRGATWTNVTSSLYTGHVGDLGYIVSYRDTAYTWFIDYASVNPKIAKIYESSIVGGDTLTDRTVSYGQIYFRDVDKSTDSIIVVSKINSYYLAPQVFEGRMGTTANTYTMGDSVHANFGAQVQFNWQFCPVSDGMLGLLIYNGSTCDTAYFFNGTNSYIVDLSLSDDLQSIDEQYIGMDFIQFCPADGDDVDNDTLAFVYQTATDNNVYFVIGYLDPSSSYDWTEVRRVQVNTDVGPEYDATPQTFSTPGLQRTERGAWICFYAYWVELTAKGIAYKYSDDDGATWSAEQILLTAAEATPARFRCGFRALDYASGDSILVGVGYLTGYTATGELYWIGETIESIIAPSVGDVINYRKRRLQMMGVN